MTDREILEFAAKAAGVKGSWHRKGFVVYSGWYRGVFDPMNDDGDALRLAVKLNISIMPYPIYSKEKHSVIVKQYRNTDMMREQNPTERVEPYADDDMAATRRAITSAAAEIGKRMP